MQDPASELPRIPLPRTPVNKVKNWTGTLMPRSFATPERRLVGGVGDLAHGCRAAPAEVVEFPLLAYLQVHEAA
jgi:hypothetical protein